LLKYLTIIFTLIAFQTAMAQTDKNDWYKSLKSPSTGTSCCDLSDCKVVRESELRPDGWWAISPVEHIWVHIPDSTVLKDKVSLYDDESVLCEIPVFNETENKYVGNILCFVPKHIGY
jgi:hypothetical protein